MKNRDRIDIVAAMLKIAENKGAKKSIIFWGAQTSNSLGQILIENLIESGLLEYDELKRLYHTTKKGEKFQMEYKEMEDLLFTEKQRACLRISR
jgi:predicted transcriptional regulator